MEEKSLKEQLGLVPEKDYRYDYMLLDRLRMDCNYFLGNGGRSERVLWAGNVEDQIRTMKRMHNEFPEGKKPEWLTMKEIEEFEQKMMNGECSQ